MESGLRAVVFVVISVAASLALFLAMVVFRLNWLVVPMWALTAVVWGAVFWLWWHYG